MEVINQKKEQDKIKKMERDRQIQSVVELKEMKIKDLQDKLGHMNNQVDSVLRKKDEQMKERRTNNDLKLQAKQFEKQRAGEMMDRDQEKWLEKLRRDEERYQKLKMDKEEYKKYMATLQKDLTLKKHELDSDL